MLEIGDVLSVFSGFGGAQLALHQAGIKYGKCYASEVDKFANAVEMYHYPDTISLGDVCNIDTGELDSIDLLIGGSPCTNLSIAGDKSGVICDSLDKYLELKESGFDFGKNQSYLFWEFIRLLRELKPRYFLLENVASMKREYKDLITSEMGIEPVMINSSLVSGQVRKRLYWTNIENITQPEDRGALLKDVLECVCCGVDRGKSLCIDANYFKGGSLKIYFEKRRRQLAFSESGLCHVGDADIKGSDKVRRVYHPLGKSPSLTANSGGWQMPKTLVNYDTWRMLTPLECERLQTVPDNWTLVPWGNRMMSNTQRYKMIGNGWTIDVISHILSHMKPIS